MKLVGPIPPHVYRQGSGSSSGRNVSPVAFLYSIYHARTFSLFFLICRQSFNYNNNILLSGAHLTTVLEKY